MLFSGRCPCTRNYLASWWCFTGISAGWKVSRTASPILIASMPLTLCYWRVSLLLWVQIASNSNMSRFLQGGAKVVVIKDFGIREETTCFHPIRSRYPNISFLKLFPWSNISHKVRDPFVWSWKEGCSSNLNNINQPSKSGDYRCGIKEASRVRRSGGCQAAKGETEEGIMLVSEHWGDDNGRLWGSWEVILAKGGYA